MVNLRVINWRCIEDLTLELAGINVFIGPNSTGKSSLAYSVYFAAKTRTIDPQQLLTQLYGYGFDAIARMAEGKLQFPVSIQIRDSEFSVKPKHSSELSGPQGKREEVKDEYEVIRLSNSPWTDEFLLPSRRIDYVHIMMLLPKIMRGIMGKLETGILGSVFNFLFELFKTLPVIPPFGLFLSDYMRGLTGLRLESATGGLKIGSYLIKISPLFSLVELITEDPYTKLQLPAELSPDGLLDFLVFDSISQKVPQNSLLIVEEPEIYKNPVSVVDFTERMVERVLDRKLSLIMTTHSDLPLTTLAKLVSKGTLKAEDVRIYYFKRDPWTKASEIKLYGDGTLESLPDIEEVTARLF